MSQGEIIQAMRRLGGKDLTTTQVKDAYYDIHYSDLLDDHGPIATYLRGKHNKSRDARSYNQAMQAVVRNGLVTRKPLLTNSANYTTCYRFVYSLV